MTDYRMVYVKKRNLTVRARMPDLSDEVTTIANAGDTRITRNSDRRIARNGDVRIARNTSDLYIREFRVRKRSFVVRGKVQNG